ncbi:MAG: hypothetical protein ABI461_22695, partial [Polyangiaceae bacterium]
KVFLPGVARAASERHGMTSGPDIDVGTSTWSLMQDDIPELDRRYVVEMTLVLFETDVARGHHWDPHAGHFKPLLTRTIRQAEE